MADKKNRVPVREQAPEVRAKNFEEVCLGYNKEEAMEEASRCLNCKNARCITGCPVNINIPAFIAEVKEGNFEKASQVIGESSALPAVCGRVCPQESQCEGKCILGIKGEPVSIGKLERFTADWARENNIAPIPAKEKKGKKVAVIGGGNVAMDAARTALRLGAETYIVYRRSEKELPARVEEVHHAKEEGIQFHLLRNPKEILVDENGWVKGLRVIKMELGEPDESGRRRPVEVPGSEYDLDVDTVIMALGTSPNPLISSTTKGLDVNKWQCIIADENNGATTKEGVYAGGDAVTGAATVILAMGAGKAAAKGIDEYLSNK
mgnify:CR=1 FL=1